MSAKRLADAQREVSLLQKSLRLQQGAMGSASLALEHFGLHSALENRAIDPSGCKIASKSLSPTNSLFDRGTNSVATKARSRVRELQKMAGGRGDDTGRHQAVNHSCLTKRASIRMSDSSSEHAKSRPSNPRKTTFSLSKESLSSLPPIDIVSSCIVSSLGRAVE